MDPPVADEPILTAETLAISTETPEGQLGPYRRVTLGLCVVAFAFALWSARDQYFIWDEWSYWTERHALLHAHEYAEFFMREHVGHWHGIIMVTWAPLERVFGLESYLPYLVPTIVAHCVAGYLLFELLCYTHIRPSIAIAAAAIYLFLGSAAGNVSFGWQIGFVAPIALCYFTLLAIERYADGGRRALAVLSVASIFVGIFSSGVGVTALVVAALAAALRRRYWLAASFVVIPGGTYLLWRHEYEPQYYSFRWSELGSYLSYAWDGLETSVEGIVQIDASPVAWLLIAAAFAGVILGIVRHDRYWSVFAATLVGAAFFYASLATQRAGADVSAFAAASERYVHVASALLLPALAYLVDQLLTVRRSRLTGRDGVVAVVAAGLFVWMLVGNVRAFREFNDSYVVEGQRIQAEVAATVALGPRLEAVDGALIPYGPPAFGLSVDVVRRLASEGKLPCDTDYAEIVDMAAKLGITPPPRREVSCAT